VGQLQPGQSVLHRYRVVRLLGHGAMGEVWEGVHEELGMPVAIKVVIADRQELIDRFMREARLMARVRHPNVVQIFDFGVLDEENPCIIMEFLSGSNLDEWLEARKGIYTAERLLDLCVQMTRALAALHRAQIIHRDVKPENMMVVEEGGELTLKLVDLGIAKPSSLFDGAKLTATGMIVGTPIYMAPEQLMGATLSSQVDVYAVGFILHQLFVGHLPWVDDDMPTVMRRLRERIPPFRSKFEKAVGIEPLIERMLHFNPTQRPTMDDVVRELEEFRSRLHMEAASTGRFERSPDPSALLPTVGVHERDLLPGVNATSSSLEPSRITEDANEPRERVHAVFVAKFPPSRLRRKDERVWLRDVLGDTGMGFSFGSQHWIALVRASDPATARERALALQSALRERYNKTVTCRATLVDEEFSFTGATLSGAAPLPDKIREIIQSLG